MEEKPVATARASVMLFDPASNTWIASGSTTGLSKVQLFRHQINNTYRVVGWKLNDKEVVLNCAIFRGMKYNQARPTFHQWRDTKHQVYGLNFTNKEEAEVFASAILEALESLNQIYRQSQQIMAQQQQQQVQVQHQQQQIEVQQGDYINEFQPPPSGPQQCIPQQLSQQQQPSVPQPALQQPQAMQMQTPAQPPPQLPVNNYQTQLSGNTSMPEYALPQKHMHQQLNLGSLNNIGDNYGFGVPATNAIAPGSNNGPSNEYRGTPLQEEVPKVVPNSVVVSAPPPPPPPGPPPPTAEKLTDMYVCTAPPPPPGPPPLSTITMGSRSLFQSMGAQSNNDSDEDSNQSAMANQLRQARLKQRPGGTGAAVGETSNESNSLPAASNKGAVTTTSGTLGRAGGGDSMMSEMQRVLAARKKAKEVGVKVEGISDNNGASGDSTAVTSSTGKNSTGQWRQNHHRSQSDCEQQQLNGSAAGAQLKPAGLQSLDTGRGNTPLQCATLGRKGSLQPDQHSSQQQQCTTGSLTRQDLDNFKREILQEVRLMIQQFKTDIIEVIRTGRP